MPVKFLHAADLHIDSPLLGLDAYPGAPVERLRGATRQALIALVDLALAQEVDFVILAGDIYDGNWRDFHTGLFFREQMVRLTRAGVQVFIVKGNHDAQSQITKQLPAIAGVHVFSSQRCETVVLDSLAVALHGRSFPERAVPEDLVPGYPPALAGVFNIGLLHTSLAGNPRHDTYAPTTVAALCGRGYDYFALGHIHAREVVREADPRIVFPGNIQGRHAGELGPKGCELVTVAGGAISSAEFVSLDVVRWHELSLDVSGLATVDALSRYFIEQARALTLDAGDRLHAVRLRVHGQSGLHRLEAAQPGTIAAAMQAATQDLDDVDLWLEQVRLDLRSPLDRTAAAARSDAVGEVVRLVDELAADEALLRAWVMEHLKELGTLPADLADADPARLDAAALRAALADAETSVLAQLSGDGGADGP